MTDLPIDRNDVVPVWIYKGNRRAETYLYVAEPKQLESLPTELAGALGALELVVQIELYPGRKLARANAEAVLQSIEKRGYYLQLPPVDRPGEARVH